MQDLVTSGDYVKSATGYAHSHRVRKYDWPIQEAELAIKRFHQGARAVDVAAELTRSTGAVLRFWSRKGLRRTVGRPKTKKPRERLYSLRWQARFMNPADRRFGR